MSDQDEGFPSDWLDKDYYADLGVAKDASQAEIKKAYKKLARENHPDANPDQPAKHDKFKKVAAAYDVVGDAAKRKKYDEMRALTGGRGGGFGGFGGRGRGGGAGAGGFDISDLFGDRGASSGGVGDMFGDLFGGGGGGGGFSRGRTQARPAKGNDLETSATISFMDAINGTTVSLRLTSEAACPDCHGTGGKPGTQPHICPECEGAGFVVNNVGGGFSINETCPLCGGRQLVYDEPCPTCGGSGHAPSSRTIQARIPAGVKDGQRIRLRGKGGQGTNGGPNGDLYVVVHVGSHPVFGRKGDNLTLDVPISFDEAALGAQVRIPTLAGTPVTLKIPAGTPSGRTFRVRGKGSTRKDGTKGDLLATVEVTVPKSLDDAAKQAVEAYRDATDAAGLRAGLFGGG